MQSFQHEQTSGGAVSAFTVFSQLPTEIRLKIWSSYLCLTLPSPISITISAGRQIQKWVADDSILRKGHPIPVILHICRESREVGLAKYVLGFDLEGGLSELPFNHCWKMVEDGET
jgi:2EXR family